MPYIPVQNLYKLHFLQQVQVPACLYYHHVFCGAPVLGCIKTLSTDDSQVPSPSSVSVAPVWILRWISPPPGWLQPFWGVGGAPQTKPSGMPWKKMGWPGRPQCGEGFFPVGTTIPVNLTYVQKRTIFERSHLFQMGIQLVFAGVTVIAFSEISVK